MLSLLRMEQVTLHKHWSGWCHFFWVQRSICLAFFQSHRVWTFNHNFYIVGWRLGVTYFEKERKECKALSNLKVPLIFYFFPANLYKLNAWKTCTFTVIKFGKFGSSVPVFFIPMSSKQLGLLLLREMVVWLIRSENCFKCPN
jgi:hypothetical protein